MRWTNLFLVILLAGCGGSLNDEQRKQLKEGREQQKIKKVTEAELTEEAFARGRAIIGLVERNPTKRDSVMASNPVVVRWLEPGAANASEIERQVIDAYLNSVLMGGSLSDNVQRLGTDSLLYTKPVVLERPDGTVEVRGTWNVSMAKKDIVLTMGKR